MSPNDGLKRYLEAGLALTQITRARAEELVHELIQAGEVETTRAQDWVEDLVKTSRERSDTLLSTVRGEVRSQLSDMGITSMDDLAHRVAEVLDKAETAARKATSRGPGRGRASHRSAPRATAAKKAPARKAPAKKAPATGAASKKATSGTTGARTTTAKKAAAKKAPSKKAAAKKTGSTTKKAAARSSTASKARR
jgi:polyhydroxyalkanoate synthesis regulator phasin